MEIDQDYLQTGTAIAWALAHFLSISSDFLFI